MNNGSSKGLYSHAKASALKSFGSDTLKERQNRAVLSLSLSLSHPNAPAELACV